MLLWLYRWYVSVFMEATTSCTKPDRSRLLKTDQNRAAKYKADSTTEEPQTSGENDQIKQGNQADTVLVKCGKSSIRQQGVWWNGMTQQSPKYKKGFLTQTQSTRSFTEDTEEALHYSSWQQKPSPEHQNTDIWSVISGTKKSICDRLANRGLTSGATGIITGVWSDYL